MNSARTRQQIMKEHEFSATNMTQDYERINAEMVLHKLLGTFDEHMYWINYTKCTEQEAIDIHKLGLTIVKIIGTARDKTYVNRFDNPFTTDGYWLQSIHALEHCSFELLGALIKSKI
jgi:hypothetical protein